MITVFFPIRFLQLQWLTDSSGELQVGLHSLSAPTGRFTSAMWRGMFWKISVIVAPTEMSFDIFTWTTSPSHHIYTACRHFPSVSCPCVSVYDNGDELSSVMSLKTLSPGRGFRRMWGKIGPMSWRDLYPFQLEFGYTNNNCSSAKVICGEARLFWERPVSS